jgi:Ser/Thr protein kinase RdoA (MazF antagonist)
MAPGTLEESTIEALHEQVASLEADSAQMTCIECAIHGDLNLSNILVERGTGDLRIIDFADGRIGLGIDDLATVYCTVSSMRAARGKPGLALGSFLDQLVDAYGQNQREAKWRLMCIMCHLRLVLSYLSFLQKGFSSRSAERAYAQLSQASLRWLVNKARA